MAVIYLKHERHGAKVAVSEWEAVYDEKHGWVRYTPEAPAEPPIDDTPEVPNFLAAVTPMRRKRA
jgi:hypothetical protein